THTVADCTGAADRIGSITRQNRDVVTLGGIEMYKLGIKCCLSAAAPADTIADVAYRANVCPGAIDDRLTRLAHQVTRTAGSHCRHVAGVEVRTKRRHDHALCRATCGWWIGGTSRVDVESAIFFNDPAIVTDSSPVRILPRHHKPACRREIERDRSHVCADCSL